MYEFSLRFHWSLFLRFESTIFHQATSHYLNQRWLIYWRIYASFGLLELKNSQQTFCNRCTYLLQGCGAVLFNRAIIALWVFLWPLCAFYLYSDLSRSYCLNNIRDCVFLSYETLKITFTFHTGYSKRSFYVGHVVYVLMCPQYHTIYMHIISQQCFCQWLLL